MKKHQIKQVIMHTDNVDMSALAARMAEYHTSIIERKLRQSGLSPHQQIEVIDKLLATLRNEV